MDSKSEVQDTVQPSKASALDASAHFYPRGTTVEKDAAGDITGYVHDRMQARALLSFEEEKKLLRRVDWRLMPLCALIFMVKNVDANNAANAKIMNKGTPRNILTELNMTSDDYNWVSSIYSIPFIVFEVPSLLIMKKMLPSRFQARIMVTWGIALACHAAVTSKEGLYTARFFLGLLEAGMFPGIILQLTYWYRTDEMTFRLLIYYSFEWFAQIISAVLAFAFDTISGRCGLSGWQWFFLVEGVITIAFGASLWFIFPDFPEQAKWLTEKEKAFLQARLPDNAPRSAESNFVWSEISETLKDVRLWLFTLIFATKTIGSSGLSFYLPTIVQQLGLAGIAESQLLTIPAGALPILFLLITVYLTNNLRVPTPLMSIFFLIVTIACYGVLYVYPNTGGVYAATVLAGAASNVWYPCIWPWRLQTTSRATGSAFAIGFVNSLGQIGTVIGPQIFQSKYAPKYTTSFAVAISFSSLCVAVSCWTWWVTRHTEKRTRDLWTIRMAAGKRGETVLDDVDIDEDFEKSYQGERTSWKNFFKK